MCKTSMILAVSLCALMAVGPASAADYNDVQDGDWTDPDTWGAALYPGDPPGGGDTATIDSNTVTLNIAALAAADVSQITMGGGTLSAGHGGSHRDIYGTVHVTDPSTLQKTNASWTPPPGTNFYPRHPLWPACLALGVLPASS